MLSRMGSCKLCSPPSLPRRNLFAYTFCKITLRGLHQALLVLRNAAPEFELSLPRFLAHLAGKLPCQEFRLEERLPNVCGTIYIYKGERNSKFGVLPTFTMSILPILVSQSRLEKGVDEEKKGTRVILIRTRPRRGVEVKAAFLFRGSCWGERRRESQLKNERR